ncbi:MAG: translation elongation factor 4, partial [Candidatus Izimaplasma sp.]|nr:translation elongation factor 4 [Candidatus Izimaplasma bacterium]
IAHIDHGKSTLADRLLEYTNTVAKRELTEQMLDQMDLEKERGITIKLNAVQMEHKDYIFNLIDTPGHVDFSYEVSRSLAACQGALLVVDATQGVQAQTIANTYLAIENNLEIIPILNKIDLPSADVSKVKQEIENILGIDCSNAPMISAKTGLNIETVVESIIDRIPPPEQPKSKDKLQALVFDSYFDPYRGVVIFASIKSGEVKKGDLIIFLSNDYEIEVTEVGVRTPKELETNILSAGEVGYISAAIKDIKKIKIGDTFTKKDNQAESLPGYIPLKPMVFCGMYPIDGTDYQSLGDAIEKISLSDSSLVYEKESSEALGFGYRMGFLGMLHLEIIQERIEREFNIPLIATSPSVIYKIYLTDQTMIKIDNPSDLPPIQRIERIEEPIVEATILTPEEYVGNIMELCQYKRGTFVDMKYLGETRVQLTYHMPLLEIVYDFFDKLKSYSKGYASFDYEFHSYQESKLVKMDILLNGEVVDALSIIVFTDFAYRRGKAMTEKLKEIIPRHMFEVPVQAAINTKIIARSTIKAMRKNVLAKCYGGDITRKKKLLEKQKKGKKKMKSIGSVEIPQEAFLTVLKLDD